MDMCLEPCHSVVCLELWWEGYLLCLLKGCIYGKTMCTGRSVRVCVSTLAESVYIWVHIGVFSGRESRYARPGAHGWEGNQGWGVVILFSNHSGHLCQAHSQRGRDSKLKRCFSTQPGTTLGCHGWRHRDRPCHEGGEKAAWEPSAFSKLIPWWTGFAHTPGSQPHTNPRPTRPLAISCTARLTLGHQGTLNLDPGFFEASELGGLELFYPQVALGKVWVPKGQVKHLSLKAVASTGRNPSNGTEESPRI